MRSGSSEVRGPGAYAALKYEGGVHRVQRVPATEKAGRIHTSTVSVAVLPVLPEVSPTSACNIHRYQRKTKFSDNLQNKTRQCLLVYVFFFFPFLMLFKADVKINPNDLKVETMRSSGAGGQHVNRTESKVRLTHLPSGIYLEAIQQESTEGTIVEK